MTAPQQERIAASAPRVDQANRELIEAIGVLDPERVILALQAGANPNLTGLSSPSRQEDPLEPKHYESALILALYALPESYKTPLPDQRSALSAAAVCAALLAAGANIDVTNRRGSTALHLACDRFFAPAVTALIQAGANLNARDNKGSTPLHIALGNSTPRRKHLSFSISLELLRAGADRSIVDDQNQRADYFADEDLLTAFASFQERDALIGHIASAANFTPPRSTL